EWHQLDDGADFYGFVYQRGDQCGRGDRHVHAPTLSEEPLVASVVDATDDAWYAELLLGEPTDHQVVLVVAGGGDHHVGVAHVRGLEAGVLTGVGRHHRDARQLALKSLGGRGGLFHQRHVMVTIDEVQSDRGADRASSGDDDFHGEPTSSNECSLASPSLVTRNSRMSSSWAKRASLLTRPWPPRISPTRRTCSPTSKLLTGFPAK